MFDFAALPPEINSARMYTGAGSGPLLSAAAAWQSLADDLAETTAQYRGAVQSLDSTWSGPSSDAMTAAAGTYMTWIAGTANHAQTTAVAATAAATAYETAYAMTVPPPEIAANRAQLLALIATNLLGQNTPAIMATEALYAEMWAQDVAAMSSYQTKSTTATTALPQFAPAAATTTGTTAATATATPAAAGGILGWLQQLSSEFSFANNSNAILGPNSNIWDAVLDSGINPATLAPILGQMGIMTQSNELTAEGNRISLELAKDDEDQLNTGNLRNPVDPAEAPVSPPGAGRIAEHPTFGAGKAGTAGFLSVPPNWDKATQEIKLASVATPLTGGAGGVPIGPPMPIAAVNGPGKKRQDGNEILVQVRFLPPKGF